MSGLRDVAGFDDRHVVPCYLPMMGYNAVGAETAILDEFRGRADDLSVEDIRRLPREAWRPRAMGAR